MPSSLNGDSYTRKTRDWLDETFSLASEDGAGFITHQPIDGFGSRRAAPCQAQRLARTARILHFLAREAPKDLLDVGAAEAYTADLVREFLHCPVATCDLSREACLRGRETFGVPTVACNAARLPFGDQAFDVVLCSEVLEHLEDPFSAIRELARVTRRALVITTQECGHFEIQRRLELKLRHFGRPHLEINWWMPDDFRRLLGDGTQLHRQIRPDGWPGDDEKNLEKVKAWLRTATDPNGLDREGVGVIAVWHRRNAPSSAPSDARAIDSEALWEALVSPRRTGIPLAPDAAEWLENHLRCPICLGPIKGVATASADLRCPACERAWERYRTLPDMTVFAGEGSRAGTLADPGHADRLRALFHPDNAWRDGKAGIGQALLAFVELARDLRIGRGLRRSAQLLRRSLGEVLREYDPRREGWLVRRRGQPEVFRIEKGRRRHITTPLVFDRLGYRIEQVREVDEAWLERFPEGEPIREA